MILLAGFVLVIAFMAMVVAMGPAGRPFEATSTDSPARLLEEAAALIEAAGCAPLPGEFEHFRLLEASRGYALSQSPSNACQWTLTNGADSVTFMV